MNKNKLNQYKEWLRKMDIFLHGDYSIHNTVTFYSHFDLIKDKPILVEEIKNEKRN